MATSERQKQFARNHYAANKQQYKERNDRMRDQLRQIIRTAKDVPCADCGERYPHYVMDFDHISDDKAYNIGKMINSGSKRKLLIEIAKCEVVCSNCHRQRTHNRLPL